MKLEGKKTLVTGADSGIGRAVAITFGREGADFVVHYGTDRKGAEETADEIRRRGHEAEVVQADLADPRNAQRLFQQALGAAGQIDVLVNCAGTSSPQGSVLDEPLDDFVRLLNVVLFLVSDDASYMVGGSYPVDGDILLAGPS